ncbi:hypothetical protein AB0D13_02960 [Streptomyces sp. NPDC048430]|uniref:hypothetical protein n=1 Tax=Streptomyces sp. NPDC048430 TaxID=3155388 RepID=UPI003416DC59
MSFRTVDWEPCECGMKRGFDSRHDAQKAMGRAQAKRTRKADARGTRRGLRVESRVYECDFSAWHMTSMSRRAYEEVFAA